jgi:monovalent cation:H+ antiporter-2, CPA2 family
VGVVLLLFALGVEFSLRELARVRRVVVPGAIGQIIVTTLVAGAASTLLGLEPIAAVVVGAAVAISSTLVVLRILVDRGELDALHGRTAIGWMIVQDLATIVLMALLEPLAGGNAAGPLMLALLKTFVFLALAYVVGTRLLTRVFGWVSRLGSPELFLLTVFATALLAAFVSSALFGLSLALGAFVAGIIVSESDLSQQAAGEITPFRDLFAVLFFVSVGMLLDPAALLADAPAVVVLLLVMMAVKAGAGGVLGRLLGMPLRSAIMLGAVIAQAGEFSFLLAAQARALDLIDGRAYSLVLGTAVLSIVLTPAAVRAGVALVARLEHRALGVEPPVPGDAPASRSEQMLAEDEGGGRASVVVLGGGRVGSVVVRAMRARGFRCIVVDRDQRKLDALAAIGAETLFGDAANPAILRRVGLDRARLGVVAIGDPLAARLAVERIRAINPRLTVIARARGRSEIEGLEKLGVRRVADPDLEAALELTRASLARMGVSGPEQTAIVLGVRRRAYGGAAAVSPGSGSEERGTAARDEGAGAERE